MDNLVLTLRSPASFAAHYADEPLDNQIGCISSYTSLLGTWLQDGSLELVSHNEPQVTVVVHNSNVVRTLENMCAIVD